MTKARLIYLMFVVALFAYYLAAFKNAGMSDGGPAAM
jgi:hypothetical protein